MISIHCLVITLHFSRVQSFSAFTSLMRPRQKRNKKYQISKMKKLSFRRFISNSYTTHRYKYFLINLVYVVRVIRTNRHVPTVCSTYGILLVHIYVHAELH